MNTALLERAYLPHATIGQLFLPNGESTVTLELPWRNHQPNISCIPEGAYTVERNTTGRHQYYQVKDVEGRTHIEFHPADFITSPRTGKPLLEGCIAPALKLRKNHYAGTSGGVAACQMLLDCFGDDDWTLVVQIKKAA